jgi:hypothetical protein
MRSIDLALAKVAECDEWSVILRWPRSGPRRMTRNARGPRTCCGTRQRAILQDSLRLHLIRNRSTLRVPCAAQHGAARSAAEWCAADTGPRFERSNETGVPDQQCTTEREASGTNPRTFQALRAALHPGHKRWIHPQRGRRRRQTETPDDGTTAHAVHRSHTNAPLPTCAMTPPNGKQTS